MVRTVIRNTIIFVVVLVVMTAVAIWLGLGPVVHSSATVSGRRSVLTSETGQADHGGRPDRRDHARSKRSRFMTLSHAATKSRANLSWESAHA